MKRFTKRKCLENLLNWCVRGFKKGDFSLQIKDALTNLSKIEQSEKLTILEIKDIQNTTCLECKQDLFNGCHLTCSIIAKAIYEAQEKKKSH